MKNTNSTPRQAQKIRRKYVTVTGPVVAVDIKDGEASTLDVRLDGGGVVRWVYCRSMTTRKKRCDTQPHQTVTLIGIGEDHWLGDRDSIIVVGVRTASATIRQRAKGKGQRQRAK